MDEKLICGRSHGVSPPTAAQSLQKITILSKITGKIWQVSISSWCLLLQNNLYYNSKKNIDSWTS